METTNAKLFAKLAAVMGKCRLLKKEGKNTFDKYDYVTADTIAQRIGELLAANGIAFFPSMISVETNEYTTQKGGTNFRTVAHFQMTFACNETGATYTSLWTGEAIDRSDKSISKAATSAVKYFLLKTFLLSGGEDDDADASSPEVEARKTAAPATNGTSHPEGSRDDELWDTPATHAKKPDTLSQAQLTRLTILVTDFYGPEAKEQQVKLAGAVSKGSVHQFKDLSAKEAAILIGGIEKKMKEVEPFQGEDSQVAA